MSKLVCAHKAENSLLAPGGRGQAENPVRDVAAEERGVIGALIGAVSAGREGRLTSF
jgi:hypothetical protein